MTPTFVQEKLTRCMDEGQRIVIDLQFTDIMRPQVCGVREIVVILPLLDRFRASPQELSSLTSQLMRCWGVQRQTWHPAAMHITSFQGPFLPYLNKVHWKSWNIKTHKQAVQDVFKTDELIYLTPDSDNVLDVIESDKVYVIGGIVDRTTTKVSCSACMWHLLSRGVAADTAVLWYMHT